MRMFAEFEFLSASYKPCSTLVIVQMLSLYSGCEVLGYVKSVQDVGTDAVDVDAFTREQVGGEQTRNSKSQYQRYYMHVFHAHDAGLYFELVYTDKQYPGGMYIRVLFFVFFVCGSVA